MATLQDVLMGGYQPPMVGGAAYQAPAVDPSLEDQAFAAPDLGPRPGGGKPNRLSQVLLGIGDALNSSASILGGADVRTHNLQGYQDYLASQQQAAEQYDRLKASQDSEIKRGKAQFLLGQNERKQMKADEQQGREDLKKMQIADREQARLDAKGLADEKLAQDKAQFEAQKAWDKQKLEIQNAHDTAMATIREKASKGDDVAKEDRKALTPIIGAIADLSLTARQNLVDGKTTPDELGSLIQNEIDKAQLSPDGEKAAHAYYNKKMADILREYQMSKQPQQGPEPAAVPPQTAQDYVNNTRNASVIGRL